MSRLCEVTGKRSLKGMQVSHAMNHMIKFQKPNLHKKRFWVAEENRWVSLLVSSAGIREVNKNGISAVLRKMAKAK